ncbi:MAG TPA: OmpA family protein [Bryobacteraceae bacterium]|nr:OmpA family protein [Bryobacteraceae bacterium]
MKPILGISVILAGALLSGGCATKKYVQQSTAPIQTKVDQVAEQANQQGTSLVAHQKQLDEHTTGINAAKERAMSAENRANEAMTAAKTADQTANEAKNAAGQNAQQLSDLKQSLGNLDDYKMAAETVIPFGFNKDTLTPDAQQQLDQFVQQHSTSKRYFITIEGFTDKTGSAAYNDALSRRRADRVMAYLVAQHNIPVFRIQEVGLGKEKPADEGRNRAARAKNRRVEVRVFTADLNIAGSQAAASQPAPPQSQSQQ